MTRQPLCRRHGGAVLVVVLSISAAMIIGVSLVQLVLMQMQQSRHDRDRSQATWLAEAGLDRLRRQVSISPDYTGETWQPEVPGAHRSRLGSVRISPTAPGQWDVVADYPAELPDRVRVRRTWSVPATALTSTEGIVP